MIKTPKGCDNPAPSGRGITSLDLDLALDLDLDPAPSELGNTSRFIPRALPWAGLSHPVGVPRLRELTFIEKLFYDRGRRGRCRYGLRCVGCKNRWRCLLLHRFRSTNDQGNRPGAMPISAILMNAGCENGEGIIRN